jgi:hypothetical protein
LEEVKTSIQLTEVVMTHPTFEYLDEARAYIATLPIRADGWYWVTLDGDTMMYSIMFCQHADADTVGTDLYDLDECCSDVSVQTYFN